MPPPLAGVDSSSKTFLPSSATNGPYKYRVTTEEDYCKYSSKQWLQLPSSSMCLAALVASLCAASITRSFGRRWSMFTGGVTFLSGTIVATAAQGLPMLTVGRILLGVGVGFVLQSVPLYISEIAPARLRGVLNVSFQLMITIGILCGYLIIFATRRINTSWAWRVEFAAAVIPSSIVTLGSLFLPDTPNSLINRDSHEEAQSLLRRIRGTEDISDEYSHLVAAREQCKVTKHPWWNILKRKYRGPLVMSILIAIFQQLAGINAMVFYAPVIFRTLAIGGDSTRMVDMILGVFNVAATLVCFLDVDRLGKHLTYRTTRKAIVIDRITRSQQNKLSKCASIEQASMGFAVTRTSKSLVAPSSPTPRETLSLSVIDRVAGLRHLVRSLHVFDGPRGGGGEPAGVLREALGKALVDYYPFAGRFVEEEGEVRVECTGEGAWFVEAVAACSLEDVKHLDHPMLIPKEELLPEPAPDVPPLDMPLMVQVTEFTCGGFVVGLISVHTIADGLGAGQFINAVADYARGLPKPRVTPIWARDLIPDPPKMPAPPPKLELLDLRYFNVDLSPDHIAKVKSQFFESTGQRCSAFDVCVAKTWQARTRALRLDAARPVHVCFFANTRHLMHNVWPAAGKDGAGFYGNCFYPVTVTSGSGEVEGADIVDVVHIIRDAKARLAADFARWAVGGFRQDPYELTFTYDSLFVSDWTRLGFLETDYGWGQPVHVIPFSYHPFMAVAVIGAPPAPKVGARVMTMCVEEEHLPEFQEQMNAFAAGN